MIRHLIICFILLVISLNSNGQDTISEKNTKNSISIQGATFVYIGGYSINYERAILRANHFKMLGCAGIGGWYFITISKNYYGHSMPLYVSFLFGSRNNYFETDLGVKYTAFSKRSQKDISPLYPILNLGYRYQRQDGKGLIFRSFIGSEGIGIGIGKAF